MGLDMYLTAKRHLSNFEKEEKEINKKIRKVIPEMFESGNLGYVDISFEAGYWRKSNQIHSWFVKNVQKGEDDCGCYYVSREKLTQLSEECKIALANKELSSAVLPTQSGFFFGNTEYDEWYYRGLEETIEIVDKCLSLPDCWNFEYQSSW